MKNSPTFHIPIIDTYVEPINNKTYSIKKYQVAPKIHHSPEPEKEVIPKDFDNINPFALTPGHDDKWMKRFM